MCGIAGFVDCSGVSFETAQSIGKRMSDTLLHRGPDASGSWTSDDATVTMVHRRLAIVDLSSAGSQPMVSSSGRYVIVLNGEVYNHKQLRADLETVGWQPNWRGHSDTETLIESIECFGLDSTLKKLVGMFAFAVYDHHTRSVYLARDRIGEKPVYYGQQNGRWYFASELKAIRCHPHFKADISQNSICLFLRHNYIPAPYSIYKDIRKLPPGCWVKLGVDETPTSYWSLNDAAFSSGDYWQRCSETEALDNLESQLLTATKLQMQADVPLGAFLSGGIDSSLIVAMMQELFASKVQSFSIGFDDVNFDEAPYAKAVAAHLGTEHTELIVSGKQALEVVPKLPELYDEPFSDSSQIPTYLVCQMASKHVTVALSGDAGDELFGGYNRYILGTKIWQRLNMMPVSLRRELAKLIRALPPSLWNQILSPGLKLMPKRFRPMNIGDKLHKAASILPTEDIMEIYLELISHWKMPNEVVRGGAEPSLVNELVQSSSDLYPYSDRMMYLDTLTYLPDDILVKVDRAAMGVSLETRVPFLDHRVVETAWQLPQNFKIRNGSGKWCLKELLYRRVPRNLIDRPKTGFGVPLESWLRNELREWAEELLDRQRLLDAGHFDPDPIRLKWEQHLSGERNWHYHIWDILMFESWRDASGS